MGVSTFKPGGFLSGQQFKLDDTMFHYKNAYGKYATVPRSAIETVVVDPIKRGKVNLKLIGAGTSLAEIELPLTWANKTQAWLLRELGSAPAASPSSSPPPPPSVPAGWYPDPNRRHESRYWDGSRWTEHVADQGVQSTDPPS